MLQRIQTLYIIIATSLVLTTWCFLPFLKCNSTCGSDVFIHSLASLIWIILFVIFSVITIFKFKNRQQQIYWLNRNLILIPLLLLILYVFHFFIAVPDNTLCCSSNWIFDISMIIGFVLFLLARRAIKKDDDFLTEETMLARIY